MSRASFINLALQIGCAGLRYAMMGWVYARSDLEAVGHINALLTYVTAATFVAGLELHQVSNRSLLLAGGGDLRFGPDRLVLAALVIGVMSYVADSLLFGSTRGPAFALLVFLVAVVEYAALESGRLLIVKGRFLVVTVCGFVRSVSPFLAIVVVAPTLEAMLCAWLVGTTLVLGVQAFVLLRGRYFHWRWQTLNWADFRSALLFFAAGVSMALMPTIERWLAGSFYSGAVLGQYALAMTLVSLCELIVQGGVWQPFIARILQRLAQPAQRRSMAGGLLAFIVAVYVSAGVAALLLADRLLALINKAPLPDKVLLGVFVLGLAKALYTLLFYCLYATSQERVLPKVQAAMLAGLALAVALGAKVGLDAGLAFAAGGVTWIGLLLVLLVRWLTAAAPPQASGAAAA